MISVIYKLHSEMPHIANKIRPSRRILVCAARCLRSYTTIFTLDTLPFLLTFMKMQKCITERAQNVY